MHETRISLARRLVATMMAWLVGLVVAACTYPLFVFAGDDPLFEKAALWVDLLNWSFWTTFTLGLVMTVPFALLAMGANALIGSFPARRPMLYGMITGTAGLILWIAAAASARGESPGFLALYRVLLVPTSVTLLSLWASLFAAGLFYGWLLRRRFPNAL